MVTASTSPRPLLLILAAAVLAGTVLGPGAQAQDRTGPPTGPPGGGPPPNPSGSWNAPTHPSPPANVKRPPQPGLPAPPGTPAAGDTLKYTRNVLGDARPVNFYADDIVTWFENGSHVVLLRGQVLIQQSVVNLRCRQAIGWLNNRSGIWHVVLYCEDQVQLDISSEVKSGARAVVELNTRGEVKLVSQRTKVGRQNLGGDPLVQRARPGTG